jgi:hypothetical protein
VIVQQNFKLNESARMGALMKNESVKERKVQLEWEHKIM